MKIDRTRTSNLAQRHTLITSIGDDAQRLALEAEDALTALEDREARRSTRVASADPRLLHPSL